MPQVAKSEVTTTWDDWMEGGPLRCWRATTGVSLMQTASRLGVSQSAVQLWENGVNAPSSENMIKLSRLLDLDPEDLVWAWTRWLTRKPVTS